MSSIAYITDNKMIEFHRINGSTTMNFWRLSTNKKFSNFSKGDFLFFLTKERARQKEKCIVGYGICKEINKLSINQMWNKYEVLNGYPSKLDLKNAILKASKDNKIPKNMSCILLENITFFQSPIYLSNFDIKISNKLESYIYLDKDNIDITSMILNEAINNGVDLWTVATSNTTNNLDEAKIIHTLSNCIDKIHKIKYNKTHIKVINNLMENLEDFKPLKDNELIYYKYSNKLEIILPFVYNQKNHDEILVNLLGNIEILKFYLNKEDIKYEFKIIYENKLNLEDESILKGINK